MILYLDQNYASHISKYLLGQKGHEYFGELYELLQNSGYIVPASSFHVLELMGGYLLPPFKEIFGRLSQGYWVRPWQEVLEIQQRREPLTPNACLIQPSTPLWEEPADLRQLSAITSIELEGSVQGRTRQATQKITKLLELRASQSRDLPFVSTLAKLLAFRSLNPERQPHDSDLADLLIIATIRPYASIIGTDRFVREILHRMGSGQGAFSGRKYEVEKLISQLK